MTNGMNADLIYASPSGLGSIWQGDAESALGYHDHFDLVVLCAEEFQPKKYLFSPRVSVLYAPNDDAELTAAQFRTAREAASLVARHVRAGEDALVTCMAGRNRSGLVSALAIHALTSCGGREARAIVRARRRKAAALTNPSFNRVLDLLPAKGTLR